MELLLPRGGGFISKVRQKFSSISTILKNSATLYPSNHLHFSPFLILTHQILSLPSTYPTSILSLLTIFYSLPTSILSLRTIIHLNPFVLSLLILYLYLFLSPYPLLPISHHFLCFIFHLSSVLIFYLSLFLLLHNEPILLPFTHRAHHTFILHHEPMLSSYSYCHHLLCFSTFPHSPTPPSTAFQP